MEFLIYMTWKINQEIDNQKIKVHNNTQMES